LELVDERALAVMVAEARHVRPPAVCSPLRVCFVREVLPELLHPVLGSASPSACMQTCPPGTQPLMRVMQPDAHPLATRAWPAVENRDMA
jgi:hypothetical protein